jgi:hypothetical protein
VHINNQLDKNEFKPVDLKLWRSYITNGIVFEGENANDKIK